MEATRVPAGHGIQWITDSLQALLKTPGPFAVMGLVIGAIHLVPVLGALAMLVIGPALYGGLQYAIRQQQRGATPELSHLFEAFRAEGKLPKMLMLCLPTIGFIVFAVVVGFILALLFGGAMLASGSLNDGDPSALVQAFGVGGVLFALLLFVPAALAVSAMTFFATSRVMLADVEPFQAMKQSFAAALANPGAFLLALIGFGLARLILFMVLMALSGPLATLVVAVAFEPLFAAMTLRGTDALFGAEDLSGPDADDLPPPALPPTPPGGGFEA